MDGNEMGTGRERGRSGTERDRKGRGRIRYGDVNKRYRQQNGTGQMETDGSKTEHIETSHQLDETRKTRKFERSGTGR